MTTTTLDRTNGGHMRQPSPNTAYWSTNGGIGTYSSSDTRRSGLLFDVSSIPSTDIISAANLKIKISANTYGANPTVIKVYRCKRAINGTYYCWNNYASGAAWQAAGGMGANDYDSTELGSYSYNNSEGLVTITIPLLISEIQKMVNGTYSLACFLLKASVESSSLIEFYSGTSTGVAQLVIDHDIPKLSGPQVVDISGFGIL